MRLLDEQYTRTPFYGIKKMTAWLETQGQEVNHKRVARLLRQMGLMMVYPKPRLSQPGEHIVRYPYLWRGLTMPSRVVWNDQHHAEKRITRGRAVERKERTRSRTVGKSLQNWCTATHGVLRSTISSWTNAFPLVNGFVSVPVLVKKRSRYGNDSPAGLPKPCSDSSSLSSMRRSDRFAAGCC